MPTAARSHSPQISVILITRNEAHNIKACLESLSDFNEIIVVDNGSSDETCTLVHSFTNAKLIESEWKGYGGTRQIAVDAASNDWILWIDADERITPDLANEIKKAVAEAHEATVLMIPRMNYFLGEHIRGCGWSPDYVTRVFNRRFCRFDEKTVHEGLVSKEPMRRVHLHSPLIHYSYTTLKQFFDKNSRYAQLAGAERQRRGRRVFSVELFVRPVWEFFRCYILKRGFVDGLRGLVICFGSAIYVFSRDAYCLLEQDKTQNS